MARARYAGVELKTRACAVCRARDRERIQVQVLGRSTSVVLKRSDDIGSVYKRSRTAVAVGPVVVHTEGVPACDRQDTAEHQTFSHASPGLPFRQLLAPSPPDTVLPGGIQARFLSLRG